MILSRPPNPPYRAPNRATSPQPPSPSSPPSSLDPSPKRKREPHPSTPEPTPHLHHDLTISPEAGNNSPRSRVAERFRTLDLQRHHTPPPPPPPPFDPKRTKLSDSRSKPRLRSPSPFSTRHLDDGDKFPELIDRQALTWQPAEITGATIDVSCGDDDGEGINGIGFRPTAAMAEKRAARRRMQVTEWKAREAREARVKRMVERKKRRGEEGGGDDEDDDGGGGCVMGRKVRFQEGLDS